MRRERFRGLSVHRRKADAVAPHQELLPMRTAVLGILRGVLTPRHDDRNDQHRDDQISGGRIPCMELIEETDDPAGNKDREHGSPGGRHTQLRVGRGANTLRQASDRPTPR